MAIKRGVSLYSYQKEYFNDRIDLEGMVALVASSVWTPPSPLPSTRAVWPPARSSGRSSRMS